MRDAVITDCVRTAIAKMNGSLSEYDEQELAAIVMKEVLNRSKITAEDVDEVIFGHVKMNTYPMNLARYGWLEAGLPDDVPGYTIQRACSSGSQSIFDASQIIACGDADVILAGGAENMTKSCYYLRNARHGVGTKDIVFKDNISEGTAGNSPEELFGALPMGLTAENVAEQYGIEREIQDLFAYNSQLRAKKAIEEGKFKEQIVPVDGFDTDEFPRLTPLEKLGTLKSVFKKGGCVTAGNSSGRNDGASAVIVMSREKADELGYDYYLRHVSSAVVGLEPSIMGVGPIEASREALAKAGLSISDVGLIELNEAFASQSVAVMREWVKWSDKETFDTIWERTNVNGSGISLGHPLAATGGILTTKLFYELKNRPDVRYAMVTMCIGGGMGFASIFEQCRR
ncbi:MAG: thiolase family protein [Clostridia bacterium]|nr:thiolase family protein [Oscillospiraceae bacterium]MBQ4538038.1 thiolase family protein [Oscillospiraceae bacterium]MBQ4637484.1 thiolase family protein [Clostridia bacterium]